MNMFNGCSYLTSAPTLPATTLAPNCYYRMFAYCNLNNFVPSTLPATTLANNCYSGMFYGCTGLTSTPSLPATTLANNCYEDMFRNCSSLNVAPELPATILTPYCYKSMFRKCTSLKSTPDLVAYTLTTQCYYDMFCECSSLNKATIRASNNVNDTNLFHWLYGVAATGVVHRNMYVNFPSGPSGIPNGWTVIDYDFKN